MIQLVEGNQPIDVKQIILLAFAQPGARKSSMVQTADKPFTIATDPGIYRAFGRKTCALVDDWQDVLALPTNAATKAAWDESKTISIDTLGMLLDKLSAAIIADNPKHGNRLGGLSLQGYGTLKAQFAHWIANIKQSGKDLVFLCHEKVEKNGDEPYYCPDIVGGSYNTMMNFADAVGYMHFANGKRVIGWEPTDRYMAKTPPCGWGVMALPDFGKEPNFLAERIAEAKASMGRISADSAAIVSAVDVWRDWLSKTGDNLERMNNGLADLGTMKNGAKKQAWALIQDHAQKQGWVFDAKKKLFVQAPSKAEMGGE
jgi:hypothetical protein